MSCKPTCYAATQGVGDLRAEEKLGGWNGTVRVKRQKKSRRGRIQTTSSSTLLHLLFSRQTREFH